MANREQEIFGAALERNTETERSAFLDAACAGAPEMRARIEALLRAEAAAGGFLDDSQAPVREGPGARIGPYQLRERIGEGGFGIVYLADQEQPVRRTVALKIIKLGMDTRAVVARFEAERQALAMMEHPNIAGVLDVGATETGRPYFVMELVRGLPITTFCDERRLPLCARLQLFLQVCRAVHHAHQKGVIHRDLKPSNILIALEGDAPMAKVIDFGIAKATREPLTEKTLLTRVHAFLGTPAYMSPEQVGFGNLGVDTRSDIYSLGALLYELLSGTPVLDAKTLLAGGYAEVQRAILHAEPPLPSQRVAMLEPPAKLEVATRRRSVPARLVAALRGDLDRIVLKCLEKDRGRRYETTEDLARDITCFLNNEPVLARPATLGYRATKFVQRHRRSVFAGAVALLLLAGLDLYHVRRLAAERDRAQLEAQKAAKVSAMLTELLAAADPFHTPAVEVPAAPAMLEASAASVRAELVAQPELRAKILNAIGRAHLRRGELDQAQSVLTEALAAGRAVGRPNGELAQALNDLGVLRRDLGDYPGASALLEEALAMRRQLNGSDDDDVAVSLVELGRAHSLRERLDLAEPMFREALAIRQKVFGGEHAETATSLGSLAVVLWEKGDLAAAEPYFQQSLAMHRKMAGPNHPNVGQAMANFALLKIDQHDLAGAETLLSEGLGIIKRSVGEKHWRTARVMGNLGEVWRRQGRLDDAARMLDDALQIGRAALGADHPLIATLAVERARVHLDRGEARAAELLLREALRAQRIAGLEGGWQAATTKSLLAAALIALGREDEAAPLLIDASRVLRDMPGPQGRETKATRERLAAVGRAKS